jgi:hypothetical protein
LYTKTASFSAKIAKSAHKGTIRTREKYKKKIDETRKLLVSILFASPSSAASFVSGYSISGPKTWKTIDGKRLKDLEK